MSSALFSASRVLRFAAPSGVTNKLLLTMGSPRESIFLNKPIESVTVPGAEGTFTLTNNHSLTVSLLKAGVITVREGTSSTDYFVSDGFVFLNNPKDGSGCCSAEISGVEIVPVSALDKDRAAQLIAELNASAKDTEWAKVKAQLGTNLLNQVIKAAGTH
jgi:F0F1-type ATP synthase epsilon subunit